MPKFDWSCAIKNCMDQELNVLRSGMPNVNNLSLNNKNWVLQSCPISIGPALWKNCVDGEMNTLR